MSCDGNSCTAEAMEVGICEIGKSFLSHLLKSHRQRCVSPRQDGAIHSIRRHDGCMSSFLLSFCRNFSLLVRYLVGFLNVTLLDALDSLHVAFRGWKCNRFLRFMSLIRHVGICAAHCEIRELAKLDRKCPTSSEMMGGF